MKIILKIGKYLNESYNIEDLLLIQHLPQIRLLKLFFKTSYERFNFFLNLSYLIQSEWHLGA